MVFRWCLAIAISLFASFAAAQFPPTPEGITTKQVRSHPGVSISYKETHICETKAKAWAGYVHMPSSYLSDIETADPYNISMFFWYITARQNPEEAPTAIYLAGGPGESSLFGATSDGGPCYVNSDSNSTYTNDYSMNEYVNMLYVDQPVGSGYSYDVLLKSTQDLLFLNPTLTTTDIVPFEAYGGKVPPQSVTKKYGVFASQNPLHTANTTGVAAATLWHFTQVWFADFPEYTTCNKKISIWGNSYGGYWVTGSGAYFQKQNVKIKNGDISGTVLEMDTIGMTNGCIDQLYEAEAYVTLAYNNTYDFPLITKEEYEGALHNWTKPDGCKALIEECRKLGAVLDPNEFGVSPKVNKLCVDATVYCAAYVVGLNGPSGRSAFDISHKDPDPFPTLFTSGFFNREWVQQDMGSPVNFTSDSLLSNNIILAETGDAFRRAGMKDVEYLLDNGVKIALIYGDRDYRCPWLGVETLSLAADWRGAEEYRAAGYEYIHTNKSYNGGVVRQYGNLSFSRVFEAGHDAAVYQPETVQEIFNRAMFNKDVATGKFPTSGPFNNYTTHGPSSSWGIKTKLPPPPPAACYLYAVQSTCTEDQFLALQNGTAVIDEGFNILEPRGGGGPVGGTAGGF